MAPTQHNKTRDTIASVLGISTTAKELSLLSTLLGGLSCVSIRGSSIVISLPGHLVRSDIEPTLNSIPGITLSGDSTLVVATRSAERSTATPLSLQTISLPQVPSSAMSEPSPTEPTIRNRELDCTPMPVNKQTRQRGSQLLETLGLNLAEAPNYLVVLSVLDKASQFAIRETKHTRSDGFIVISVETQNDATSLLDGLGFRRVSAPNGNLWAGLSYQRVCHISETKASASIAHTARGCALTIEYGEPLTDSRTIARDFSTRGSTSLVD
jgi:hypothetical protein